MSLINQVLQNVEFRQGVSPAAESPWAAQVKPVLSAVEARGWQRPVWLWLALLFTVLLIAYASRATWLPNWQRFSANVSVSAPNIAPAPVLSQPAVVQSSDWRQRWDGQPQLSKSLSSDWRSMAGAKPSQDKLVSEKSALDNVGTRKGLYEQAVVAANSPAPTTANTVVTLPLVTEKSPSANLPPSAVRGEVVKQMKPDQEANVLMQRAQDHEQKGRVSEAVATLRQAVAQYPQSEDARLMLVNHLFENKQDNEAIALLQTGIASHPEQYGLRKALARWQLSHAQPEAALASLKPMLNGAAQDAEWQWMMAMAYQQTGQHAFAIPYFDQALRLQPGQAQWYVAAAMSLQALGQHAAALAQLQTAQNLPMSERMADFVAQRIQQLSASPSQ